MAAANLASLQKLVDSNKRALVKFVYIAGSVNEANTIMLDPATLAYAKNANGYILGAGTDRRSNYRTTIKHIFGNFAPANSYSRLIVGWQGDTNSAIIAEGGGRFDYGFEQMGDGAVIKNPEANATGNIILTTTNITPGDTFTLFIDLRKDSYDFDAGQTADHYAFNK